MKEICVCEFVTSTSPFLNWGIRERERDRAVKGGGRGDFSLDRVDFTPTLSEYPVVMYFVRSNEQPWNIKIDILSSDYSRVRNRIRRGVTSVSGKLVKQKT